jgi:inorganic pyrophosphatase
LCSVDVEPMCLLEAKVIGVMHMVDQGEIDDKIIAVARRDISVNHFNDISVIFIFSKIL